MTTTTLKSTVVQDKQLADRGWHPANRQEVTDWRRERWEMVELKDPMRLRGLSNLLITNGQ